MMKYVFAEDEPLRIKAAGKANPQVIGEALDVVRKEAGGTLEPKRVVNAARNLSNPLHQHFEWDDTVAAESYRIDQARTIIRIVRIVDESVKEGTTRAFVSINTEKGTSYRSMGDVKSSRDFQLSLLAAAEKDVKAFQTRYAQFKEICAHVREAEAEIARRREALSKPAAGQSSPPSRGVKHETRQRA
jgi:hypothetical protein